MKVPRIWLTSGQNIKDQFEVFSMARERRLQSHRTCWIKQYTRREAGERIQQFTGSMGIDSTKGCWNTGRTRNIIANLKWCEASSECSRSTTTTATWCTREIPRIVRPTEKRIASLPVSSMDRTIGLCENE